MATRKTTVSGKERNVGAIFPAVRLKRLKASRTVLSMTPSDFKDMERAVIGDEKVDNKKVQSLTIQDLITIESLFSDYRMEVIANFSRGSLAAARRGAISANGSSCCCCCTPCCCCAAADTSPFAK